MGLKDLCREYQRIKPDKTWSLRNKASLEGYFGHLFEETKKGPIFVFKPVFATLSVAFVVCLTLAGLVYASSSSLPGNFLYPLKKISEKTKLALTFDEGKKAVFKAELLSVRLEEASTLQEQKSPLLKVVTEDFQKEVKSLKKEIASKIKPEEAREKDILSFEADLPIEDKKEVVPFFENTEEIKKLLAETKESLAQKNLAVALKNLELIEAKNVTSTEAVEEKIKEENTTSTPAPKTKPLLKKKELEGSLGNLRSGLILEPEKTGVEIGEIKREE